MTQFKKIVSFLLALVLVVGNLVACSKTNVEQENGDVSSEANPIVSVWERNVDREKKAADDAGIEVTDKMLKAELMFTVEFSKDGTGTWEKESSLNLDDSSVKKFKWDTEEDVLTLNFESGQVEKYEYKVADDRLTLSQNDISYELDKKMENVAD